MASSEPRREALSAPLGVLGQAAALGLVFLAAFAFLDFTTAGVLSLAVILAYMAWTLVTIPLRHGEDGAPLDWVTRVLVSCGFGFAQLWLGLVVVVFVELVLAVVLGAVAERYDVFWVIATNAELGSNLTLVWSIVIAVLVIAGSAFLCLLTFPRGAYLSWPAFRSLVGGRWLAAGGYQIVLALAVGTAFFGVFSALGTIMGFDGIAESLSLPWHGDGLAMLTVFPSLSAALIGAAMALAAHRGLMFRFARLTVAGSGVETASPAPRPRAHLIILLCVGLLAGTYQNAVAFRIGITSAFTIVPAIPPVFATDGAIRDWIRERAAAGDDPAEVAARLTEMGRWDSAEPERGLVELLPSLAEPYAKLEEMVCTFRVRAGTLSEDETAALPQAEGDEAPLPIKYCFLALCRQLPVLRDEDRKPWVISSHASANAGWAKTTSAAVLTDELPTPGGFCTRGGELAEGYQG